MSKYIFVHQAIESLKEYLEYKLITKFSGYRNINTELYQFTGSSLQNYATYSAPFSQWQYQSDPRISGATIYDGATELTRGFSGLRVDFENGRAIFDSGYVPTGTLNATYAIKDFNLYVVTSPDEPIIFDRQYQIWPDYQPEAALQPDAVVAPCIMLNLSRVENEPLCFGGEDDTRLTIEATFIARDLFSLYGVGETITNLKKTYFGLIPQSGIPLNEFGDYKTGVSWNYTGVACPHFKAGNKVFIDNIMFTPFDETNQNFNANNPRMKLGYASFSLSFPRYPRQS